jgi:hypothetical protein
MPQTEKNEDELVRVIGLKRLKYMSLATKMIILVGLIAGTYTSIISFQRVQKGVVCLQEGCVQSPQ